MSAMATGTGKTKSSIVLVYRLLKAQFRDAGGCNRINKIFNGELGQVLENLNNIVWQQA